MVIVNWKLRPKGDRVNPYVKYKNDLNLFTLKVNHGGVFTYVYGPKRTRAPRRVYKGGNAGWFDDVDAGGFYVLEVSSMVKELGYENPQMKFYYKKPTVDLDEGLEPLSKDIDVLDMLSYVNKYKLMEVFIEHPIDNSVMDTIDLEHDDASAGLGDENVGNVANDLGDENVEEFDPLFSYPHMQTDNNEGSDNNEGNDHNEGSDNNKENDHNEGSDNNEVSYDNYESDDSDFECDIKDRIDDVHVDMQMFKDNIDPNVEWDFDSEIDSDDDEAERRKSLRKLGKCHKPVDGNTYTKNFYVGQTFPNKELIKDMVTKISVRTGRELHMTINDKERVRAECKGIVLCFSNSGLNEDRLVDGPSGSKRSGLSYTKKKTKNGSDIKKKVVGDTILTAIGMDPLYGTYPLAYAIVESENKQAWPWFFNCLGDDLELFRNSNFTFVTDRQKGLIPALVETFPAAEHRNIKELKGANKELHDWLKLIPAQHWARYALQACSRSNLEHGREWLGTRHTIVIPHIPHQSITNQLVGLPRKERRVLQSCLMDWSRMASLVCLVKQSLVANVVKKGHNSRTCKGQRGATSAPAVNQTRTTQTTVNPSAPATSPTMRYTKQKASRYSPAKNTNASGSGKRKAGE
nr:transposase, MuDR [Tanacetum cinerariifolium]